MLNGDKKYSWDGRLRCYRSNVTKIHKLITLHNSVCPPCLSGHLLMQDSALYKGERKKEKKKERKKKKKKEKKERKR